MKKSFIASIAIALSASLAAPVALAAAEQSQAPAEGLVEVQKGAFQSTWVNPEFDFSQYDKVVVAPYGVVDFRDVGPEKKSRTRMLNSNEREFGVSERDRERFSEIAGEAFAKSLAKSKRFELLDLGPNDRIEPGTLILRSHAVDVVSNVAPPLAGSGAVYSNRVGEATVIIEVIDSHSGKVVAYAAERNRIQRSNGNSIDLMMEQNSVTAWAEVRRWASRIGARMASGLDEAAAA